MVAVDRLRALRLQLLVERFATAAHPARSSAAGGTSSDEGVVVVSWGMSSVSEEDQAALDQVSANISRPIRVHQWSKHVRTPTKLSSLAIGQFCTGTRYVCNCWSRFSWVVGAGRPDAQGQR